MGSIWFLQKNFQSESILYVTVELKRRNVYMVLKHLMGEAVCNFLCSFLWQDLLEGLDIGCPVPHIEASGALSVRLSLFLECSIDEIFWKSSSDKRDILVIVLILFMITNEQWKGKWILTYNNYLAILNSGQWVIW